MANYTSGQVLTDAHMKAINGCTTATSVVNVPITHQFVLATISASASFSLSGIPASGNVVHVIIKNSDSATITITLPTASTYVNLSDDTIDVDSNGYAEINCISDGTNVYIRTA